MSHTILYRAMYLRLSDNTYIPMIEAGDNNVWCGNKRNRTWSNGWHMFSKKLSYTKDEILNIIESLLDELIYEGLVVSGKPYTTTSSDIRNFFMSGIKKSITFDYAMENGAPICIRTKSDIVMKSLDNETDFITEYKSLEDSGEYPTVYYYYVLDSLYKSLCKKVERKYHDKAYVLHANQNYIHSVSSRFLRYALGIQSSHHYSSYNSALKAAENIERRFKIYCTPIEIVKQDGVWKESSTLQLPSE